MSLDGAAWLGNRTPGSSRDLSTDWQAGLSIWPPSPPAGEDPRSVTWPRGRLGCSAGLAGKQEWGGGWAAGEAFPVSRRWKGSPHAERTPRSVAVARSEVSPRPGSFQNTLSCFS